MVVIFEVYPFFFGFVQG